MDDHLFRVAHVALSAALLILERLVERGLVDAADVDTIWAGIIDASEGGRDPEVAEPNRTTAMLEHRFAPVFAQLRQRALERYQS